MAKEKKSMDEVLASIRRIIRTDPKAGSAEVTRLAAPEPPAATAEEEFRKPLSTSDDPDETARAVLEELKKQAEAGKAAGGAGTTPPELDRPLRTPPKTTAEDDYVPSFEEVPSEESLVLRPGDRRADTAAPGDKPQKGPAPMDEAALEAMIRRIVRDELTGDMGKRLTKSVQRMIQAEIAKAKLGRK